MKMKVICVICGKSFDDKNTKTLSYSQGIAGTDLGDVCNSCIRHIEQYKYFTPINERPPRTKNSNVTIPAEIPTEEEEVLNEINRLRQSPYVKLAKRYENTALRQKMYQLRSLDKKGRKIAETLGIEVEDNG